MLLICALNVLEGDMLQIKDGSIFEVKGVIHPQGKAIATIRYLPDHNGDRFNGEKWFRKISSMEEKKSVQYERYKQFLRYDPFLNIKLCEIDLMQVCRYYSPPSRLRELLHSDKRDHTETLIVKLVKTLANISRIKIAEFGIIGSTLPILHTPNSDLDVLLYGQENSWRLVNSLCNTKISNLRDYNESEVYAIIKRRWSRITNLHSKLLPHEYRKRLQGIFHDREFFVRCVKRRHEVKEKYGDRIYTPIEKVKIRCTISDDSESLLTPCKYKIKDVEFEEGRKYEGVELEEIVSYRSRFCEHAVRGEKVQCYGKLEKSSPAESQEEYYRIVLGNDCEDYMILS